MFFMNINEALKDWGLNDKEAKVYLATLQLGLSRVNDIAKKAGILRETTYFVLNSLIQRGLVGYVLKSGVKFFEAADPGKFISILKEKETKMKEILPNLEEIKKSIIEKPVVELYEGKEGLKTILDDIIKTKQPMWAYANYKIFELLQFEFPHFVEKRIRNKIYARIIQERVPSLKRTSGVNRKEYRGMRFSPIVLKSNVFIYGDRVALINVSERNPIGVIIEDRIIADTQRQIFNILWDVAKP